MTHLFEHMDGYDAARSEIEARTLMRSEDAVFERLETRLAKAVEERIQSDFRDEHRDAVRAALIPVSDSRVKLAVLELTDADVTRVDRYVEMATQDFRDVLALAWPE